MNKIEISEINPHSYNYLFFNKGAKTIHWRKDNLFNKIFLEKWISICRGLKLDPISQATQKSIPNGSKILMQCLKF
jgi:hypothetical protein